MTTIKELKKDAKVRLSGNYFKLIIIYFIYTAVILAFTLLRKYIYNSAINTAMFLILLVFSIPFSYGLISSFIDIVRGKNISITEFINVAFKNISKSWKVFLRIVLNLALPIVTTIATTIFVLIALRSMMSGENVSNLFILSLVLYIVSSIWLFIMIIHYSLSFYILKDNPEKSSKEIVSESNKLMKGNIVKYLGLVISFIGWFLLIFAIQQICKIFISSLVASIMLEIGIILLFPYLVATTIGFYEDLVYDEKSASEKE